MDNRRQPRSISYAKIVLSASQVVGHVRDLSEQGCRMSFLEPPPVSPEEQVDVMVVPAEETGIAPIKAVLTMRWVRPDGPAWFAGGSLSQIPAESKGAWESLVRYFQNGGQ